MTRASTDVVILDGRRGGETSADPAFKALTDEIACRGLDHSLPNLPPVFVRIRGETHHPWRYASRASLAALGVLDQPNEEEQRLFETVVQHNAINYHSPRQAAGVVLATDSLERLRAAATGLLDRVLGRGDRR